MTSRTAPILSAVAVGLVAAGVAAGASLMSTGAHETPTRQVELVQPAAETVTVTPTETATATPAPSPTTTAPAKPAAKPAPKVESTPKAATTAATVQRQATVAQEPAPETSTTSEAATQPSSPAGPPPIVPPKTGPLDGGNPPTPAG